MPDEGRMVLAGLSATCMYCLIGVLGIAHTVINIIAVVASSDSDGPAMQVDAGRKYYLTLPIISIVIPNPITSGMTAFTDCNDFNNCGENYRTLYTAAFGINIATIALSIGACCFMCCGLLSGRPK